jgi:SAM-dependent methyltransferase
MFSLEIINKFTAKELNWLPELGIGYYPVTESPYDESYFAKYQQMAKTEIGERLNQARIDLVNKYTSEDVLDIGIGSGAFVDGRPKTFGCDINPVAVAWLTERNKYRHPINGGFHLTFWDSLEHIHDPKVMLNGAKSFVFVSCPIYKNCDHILASKHFRKDEHCWYWTAEGLKKFMGVFGFELIEMNQIESDIGREDIGTFVFKRIEAVAE